MNYKWLFYDNAANSKAYDTKLPGFGFNPSRLSYNSLSNNGIDIETFLFGINSTNLVNPRPVFTPELKCLDNINLITKDVVYLPEHLSVNNNRKLYLQ